MNREQRRNAERKMPNSRIDAAAKKVLEYAKACSAGNELDDGDKVILNLEKMKSRNDWPRLQHQYQKFVETHKDTVFTAMVYHRSASGTPVMVELEEEPKWLFWAGDLIRLKKELAPEE